MISFEIIGLPETYNKMKNKHWGYKSKHNKQWKMLVEQVLFFKKMIPQTPFQKAKVKFIRCSSAPMDFDNLVQSFKVIQDALVETKVLANDTMANIKGEYEWRKVKPNEGKIIVNVEEVIE